MQEALNGEAVFVYDTSSAENHKGKTTGRTDNGREVDFVQKMINHILVPLRASANEADIKNTLTVDGYYGNDTRQAIEAIISGGTDPTGSTIVDTNISHHIDEANSLNTFKKLAKDYSGINDADIGKTITKEILVGINRVDTDRHPTNNPDIGIYELYLNDDWDGDGISNYIEVENGIDQLTPNTGYTYPPDSENPSISVERGHIIMGL